MPVNIPPNKKSLKIGTARYQIGYQITDIIRVPDKPVQTLLGYQISQY